MTGPAFRIPHPSGAVLKNQIPAHRPMKQRLHIPLLLAVCLALTVPSGCRPDHERPVSRAFLHPPLPASTPLSASPDTTATLYSRPAEIMTASAPPDCADSAAGRVECRGLVSGDRAAHMAGETVSLRIDSGAVRGEVEVTVAVVGRERCGAMPPHLANLTAGGGLVRLLPDGQRFEKEITLALRYDSAALPYGYSAADIHTYCYNESARIWQRVARDSVDTVHHIVYSRTAHFSDYINGVLREPEGCEAVQHTSTALSAVEPAHPLDGVTLIAPPEAVSSGAATLEHPLTLPAGRRGMTPRLVVSYNSAGGNGVLGQGWSLPVSEISVETRWGVPRYDAGLESEDYLLDGAPLVTAREDSPGLLRLDTPVRRRPYGARRAGAVRYYARVEGAFRRIVRHGSNPTDYWWEVTDKDGTRHRYGQSAQARLSDAGGRTARWYLERSEDPWGNTVDYRYRTRHSEGGADGAGRQVLLEEIQYSGNTRTGDKGHYSVHLSYAPKADPGFSFRAGFQEDDGVVLDRVEVRCGRLPVRSWWFGYRQSALGKTLLCSIAEGHDDQGRYPRLEDPPGSGRYSRFDPYGRCGLKQSAHGLHLHLLHHFDYHDLEGPLYSEEVSVGEIGGSGDLYSAAGLLWDDGGRIGGSLTGGWSLTGGLNVGVGTAAWLKRFSAGGHYTYSRDKSWGLVTLADLDGDGLPDKLYLGRDGRLRVRLQLPGRGAFGPPAAIATPGCFLRTENRSDNRGVEASAAIVGGGLVWTDSRSATAAYLTDINGDGLPDIVDGGRVYLNRGGLRFDDVTCSDTLPGGGCGGGAVRFDGEVDTTLFDDGWYTVARVECSQRWEKVTLLDTLRLADGGVDTVIERTETLLLEETCDTVVDTLRYTHPRHYEPDIDLVRMWVAPYSGAVLVDGVARLSDSLSAVRAAARVADGVWACVQRAQDTVLSASAAVTPGSPQRLVCAASVSAGDTLYFRLNALGSRRYDEVEWNPRIRYTRAVLADGTVVADSAALCATDAVGDSLYRFDYARDYLLSGSVPVSAGDSSGAACWNRFAVRSRVRSTAPPGLPLRYRLAAVTLDTFAARAPLAAAVLPAGRAFDTVLTDTVTVPAGSGLLPCLSAGGPVRWGAVEASAEVTLVGSGSAWLSGLLADSAARKTFVYRPAVEIRHHDYLAVPGEAVPTFSMPAGRTVTFSAAAGGAPFSGTLPLTVRHGPGHMHFDVRFRDGAASLTLPDTVQAPVLHFDFHSDSAALCGSLAALSVDIGGTVRRAALYAVRGGDKRHGTLYRGWGQFGYKNEPGCRYIKRGRTAPPAWCGDSAAVPRPDGNTLMALQADSLAAAGPEADIDGLYNPLAETFFEMRADGAGGCWRSYGDAVTAGRNLQSLDTGDPAARSGEEAEADATISPLPVLEPGVPLKAVDKLTLSSSRGATVNHVSWSRGGSRLTSDFTDLNGDGYPDIVSAHSVQYSKAQGGLGALVRGHGEDCLHRDTVHSNGAAFNGTFLVALHEAASNAKAGRVITAVTGLAQLLSGSVSASYANVQRTLLDANGDGLPDIVRNDGTVRYNTGYGFTAPRPLPLPQAALHESRSEAWAGGAAFNIGSTSVTGGVSLNHVSNRSTAMLADLTGDGLPDLVNNGYVCVNRGDGTIPVIGYAGVEQGEGTSLSATASVTADAVIPLFGLPLKAGGSAGGGVTASLNGTEGLFVDFDGDGCADYLYRDGGDIKVRYSRAAKCGLLRAVHTPTRAVYAVGYTLSAPSVQSPRRHWEMTSLKIYDGYGEDGGEDTLYRRFSYSGRRHDRHEREDLGVAEAVTEEYATRQAWLASSPDRRTVRRWHNSEWRLRGLPVEETVEDIPGGARRAAFYTWRDADLRDGRWHDDSTAAWCRGDAWPALAVEETLAEENQSRTAATRREYHYGPWGNTVYLTDHGDVNDPGDNCAVTLTYGTCDETAYIVANVTEQTVYDGRGDLLRRRTAAYTPEGGLTALGIWLDDTGTMARWRIVYDACGNIDTLYTPAVDTSGLPYWTHYRYDTATRTLPVLTEDAEGYYSSAGYDLRWQKPLWVQDIGKTGIWYGYDRHGRLATVTTQREKESAAPYTLRYSYWSGDSNSWMWYSRPDSCAGMAPGDEHRHALWARTSRRDEQHPGDDIETVVFCDGLGRTLQHKQDVETHGGAGRRVSGSVVYDGLGRVVEECFPFFEPLSAADTHLAPRITPWRLRRGYDGLDRLRRLFHADGTDERFDFIDGTDSAGVPRQLAVYIDRNGFATQSILNHRGLTLQSTDALGGVTRLSYDALGRIVAATDPEGHTATHTYDLGGRRISRRHPATGVTLWRYDAAGNTVAEATAGGDSVRYRYRYNRLLQELHSRSPWNDVRYEYGAPLRGGASGRVVQRQDAAGVTHYDYDALGNVTRERRTCVVPGSRDPLTLTAAWDYDSWGRVQHVVYPDSERVDYTYNYGGALQHVEGRKPGQNPSVYIQELRYDLHGNPVMELDGGGVETWYAYDTLNLRLARARVRSLPLSRTLADVRYSYDPQGNITSLSDSGMHPRQQTFVYDSLHRLVHSGGGGAWRDVPLGYTAGYTYSPAGRLLEKEVAGAGLDNIRGYHPIEYRYIYSYPAHPAANPFGADHVDETLHGATLQLQWSGKGEMVKALLDEGEHRLCWDEESRLQGSRSGNSSGHSLCLPPCDADRQGLHQALFRGKPPHLQQRRRRLLPCGLGLDNLQTR